MSASESTTTPILDDCDWSRLTFGERVKQLELEGYLVLPGLLTADHVARLKQETAQLPTRGVDYSTHQRGCPGVQFHGGAITELIANPPAVEFLEQVFGDDLILMSYDYVRSEPGHPGVSFHTDGQPYGSTIFGAKHTCPVMVRVLYYLDDLTPEVSPFRVIPRSHLSMHSDGNPYHRYEGHPEEVMVTAKAGSAVLINYKVFHGNYPNRGDRAREMLALAYRPAWAGPLAEVEDWDRDEVAKQPPGVRKYLGDRNMRRVDIDVGNKPANMRYEAPGIDPSRWSVGKCL